MTPNKIFLVFALIFSTFASAQVGIGTQNPQGIFNIDGAKDNATSGAPTVTQQANDFVVLPDGKVGIGTTAPNQSLQVVGNINFSGALMPNNAAGTAGQVLTSAGAGAVPTWATISATNIYTGDGTVLGNRTVTLADKTLNFATTSGKVGIGVAAPEAKLHVNSEIAATDNVNAAATLLQLSRPSLTNVKWNNIARFNLGSYEVSPSPNNYGKSRLDLALTDTNNTAFTNVMTWQANGNVGIGTTAPTQKLDVVGAGLFRNGNDSGQSTKDQILMSYNTTANFTHAVKTRHSSSNAQDNAIDFYTWNQGVDANSAIGTKQVMSLLGNGNVGIRTTTPSAPLVVQGTTGNGVLKLIAPSVAAGDNWWMGFGHGTTSTDANDRARIGVNILGGGQGRLFFTTGVAGSQVNAMFIDESQRVGIGTTAPSEKLEVAGKTKTTNFQMTNGAANNFILTSDASGNGTWKNAQEILVNKISVTPPVGTTANYTIPCDATFDIIQITNTNANFATIITLPTPACAFAGQKVKIISTATSEATISKTNTNTYGTTLLNTGDVYEYTFSNGKWELTSFPTRNRDFYYAPNNGATTLVNPSTPKTVYYFYNGCWGSPVTLPAGGTLGDVLIIDDKATFNVVIKQANTTLTADFTLITGSYVQFIKTNLGWVKQF